MRPEDWSAVGLAADPVPGDAVMVLTGGTEYLDVADSIDRAGQRRRASGSAARLAPSTTGGEVYRVYGGDSTWYGKSWSPVDPRTLRAPRSTLGVPTGGRYGTNTMEHLILGRLDDLDHVEDVRHALPLDGLPSGAPEYVIDWSRTGAVQILDDVPLAVR